MQDSERMSPPGAKAISVWGGHGKKNYIVGIDLLRFVAAVLVMWFHFAFLASANQTTSGARAGRHLLHFPALHEWAQHGWVGVQLFFVISGFVIAFSSKSATPFSFFVSRVVRLVPAAWVCGSVTLAFIFLLGPQFDATEVWRSYRHSMLFLPWAPWIDGTFWTLSIEISFYACIFALLCMGRFRWIRQLAIFIGLASSAFWLADVWVLSHAQTSQGSIVSRAVEMRAFDLLLVHHGVFFAIGALLWLDMCDKHKPSYWFWMGLFAVVGAIQIAAVQLTGEARQVTYVPVVMWLVSVTVLIMVIRFNHVMQKLPAWSLNVIRDLGAMTYPLYLLHTIVGCIIIGLAIRAGVAPYPALALGTAAVLGLAWVIARFAEPALQRHMRRALLAGKDQLARLRAGRHAGL